MTDASGSKATPVPVAVNLTTLGGQQDKEVAIDFSPLSKLVKSLYEGNYKNFFAALGEVEVNFLSQDRQKYALSAIRVSSFRLICVPEENQRWCWIREERLDMHSRYYQIPAPK